MRVMYGLVAVVVAQLLILSVLTYKIGVQEEKVGWLEEKVLERDRLREVLREAERGKSK